MKEHPSDEPNPTRPGPGVPTREKIQARAKELAQLAGRTPPVVAQVDYEQAKRELTGERDLDRQEAVLGAAKTEKPWDPSPGLTSPPFAP